MKTQTIDQVFDCIRSERGYQKRRWGVRQADGTMKEATKPVESYLAYMKHYLDRAFAAISTENGDEGARIEVCKVVALGVKCLEDNGALIREKAPVVNGHDGKEA